MIRVIATLVFINLIQGCSTFHIGDLQVLDQKKPLLAKASSHTNTPVVVNYFTTYGDKSESDTQEARELILETTKKYFPNVKVGYPEDFKTLPERYTSIQVIQDFAYDHRDDYPTYAKPTGLLFAFSFALFPFINSDIKHYVKISNIINNENKQNITYLQDSRRFMSLLLLFSAPFKTINNSLNSTLSSSIEEHLKNES
jgi:hypothetical protein